MSAKVSEGKLSRSECASGVTKSFETLWSRTSGVVPGPGTVATAYATRL